MSIPINSRDTRVQPVFRWLQTNGDSNWPARLIQLANGIARPLNCGQICQVTLEPEVEVPPMHDRLAWMLKNSDRLAPRDGRQWRALHQRVADRHAVQEALVQLEAGATHGIPRKLVLEGKTRADCLIECQHAFIWIEGKRFDWLSPSITWDVTRDQLARNVEAVWSLAQPRGKDYCVLICHEHPLKHHEVLLLEGYWQGTWVGGWPHIAEDQRHEFGERIGTITWDGIAQEWPDLRSLLELQDLGQALDTSQT